MKMSRRNFLRTFATAVAGGLATATGGYVYTRIETEQLAVEQIQIPIKALEPALEGLKIVQMSDFHLSPYTRLEFIQQAIKTANNLQPDLMLLTGDYVNGRNTEAILELAPVLATLNARYGIFAVMGNHDLWADGDIVKSHLTKEGVVILDNQGVSLGVGSATLNLAGVDDGLAGRPDLKAALNNLPRNAPTILLAHEPDLVDDFSTDGRISLQLSGHSHGGQVRLPGLGAPILPHLGQKYDQGLYKVRHTWLYTTRGIGTTGVPLRFNCPPEITVITLVGA